MRTILQLQLLLTLAGGLASSLIAADDTATEDTAAQVDAYLNQFSWVRGPGTATMGDTAQIEVPTGFQFADGETTRVLLEAMGNLTSGNEVGFLAPTSLVWFVVFRFSEDGYVKDDEKDALDSAGMLKTIQRGTEYSNKERQRLGFPEMHVVGWEQQPVYNQQTHNLEWAIRGECEGEQVVNFNTRILGRRGVMEVKLVVEPERLQGTLPEYKQLLTTYTFRPGHRYAEYRAGDKVAQYGLAALVTGGAVAVAAKTGMLAWAAVFLKKVWKLLVVAVIAVGGFFKRFIVGRTESRASVE